MAEHHGQPLAPVGWLIVAVLGCGFAAAFVFVARAMAANRVEMQRRHCVSNLRFIEDAIDEVMSASNFTTTASVTPAMVGEYLKSGSMADLNWPRGATVNGRPADVEASWESALGTSDSSGLAVVFRGETISTGW